MELKQFAYEMKKATGISQSHCYEIIAAYVGYNTYAAMGLSAYPPKDPGFDKAKRRCEELGYDGSPAVWVRENIGSAQ